MDREKGVEHREGRRRSEDKYTVWNFHITNEKVSIKKEEERNQYKIKCFLSLFLSFSVTLSLSISLSLCLSTSLSMEA